MNSGDFKSQVPTKVLVIEDSRAIKDMLKLNIVERLHIEVESAANMEEKLKILELENENFFFAILDLKLPDAPNGEIVDLALSYGVPPIVLTVSISDDLHDEMMGKPIIDPRLALIFSQ